MSEQSNQDRCDFCQSGHVTRYFRQIPFRQQTDKGYVSCRVTIPLGVCDQCGSKHWTEDAEAITEAAVRREYVKISPQLSSSLAPVETIPWRRIRQGPSCPERTCWSRPP